eukprot:7017755-Alexandrium_andersonii.AAC.1
MKETLTDVFGRARVVDHATVQRFMSDQVTAWGKLHIDAKLTVQSTLRAAVKTFATHPRRFVNEGGVCEIDPSGWVPATPVYRFVVQLC